MKFRWNLHDSPFPQLSKNKPTRPERKKFTWLYKSCFSGQCGRFQILHHWLLFYRGKNTSHHWQFTYSLQSIALCDITNGQKAQINLWLGSSRLFSQPAAHSGVALQQAPFPCSPARLFFSRLQERPINLSSSKQRETVALSTGLTRILTGSCYGNRRLLPCVMLRSDATSCTATIAAANVAAAGQKPSRTQESSSWWPSSNRTQNSTSIT